MEQFWIETVKIRTIKRMCQICSPIGKFLILQYWHYIIGLQNEKWGGKGHIRRIIIRSTMKTDCKQSERCSGNLRGAQIEAMNIEQGAHGQCWLQMQMLCPPFKWPTLIQIQIQIQIQILCPHFKWTQLCWYNTNTITIVKMYRLVVDTSIN